jgi:CDP-diacylglycerol--glycerol-3-phosphate 3-phosphatidyltransferase
MSDYLSNSSASDFRAIVPAWAVAIIIIRELMVSGIRLVAAERGVVIAAGWSGKVKTAFTMITLILCFLCGAFEANWYVILCTVMLYISVILTIYSGAVYLIRSRKLIFESI